MNILILLILVVVIIGITIYCIYCKKIASIIVCKECGTKITDKNAKQCPKCGNPIR